MKFIFIIIFGLVFPAHATKDTNWPTYANDAGSSKYTPITKIDADNAKQLKMVWTWDRAGRTDDTGKRGESTTGSKGMGCYGSQTVAMCPRTTTRRQPP